MQTIFVSLLTLLLPSVAMGFTLNPNTGKGFKSNNIKIYIANTDCSGAGFSTTKFRSLIKDAVSNYWNQVPTSALSLEVKSIGSIDVTGDDFSDAIAKVPNNAILAGCNESATGFSNGGEPSTTLGAAVMSCSGDDCRAVLLLNASSDSLLPSLSDSDVEATIAHEIGHAFGLGHSEYQHNLMYYSIGGKHQKWLGQDDVDGVTYLYPHDPELIGLLGSCGTISTNSTKNDRPFYYDFLLGVFAILAIRFLFLFLSFTARNWRIFSKVSFGHRP